MALGKIDIHGDLKFKGGAQLRTGRVENLAADPVAPYIGQVWFNTADVIYRGFNGIAVIPLGVNLSAVNTLGTAITNIAPTSSGNVGEKGYAAGTVPANAILTEATSDTNNVRVFITSENASAFYAPTLTVNGITVTNLAGNANDPHIFTGYADITVSGIEANILVTSSNGSNAMAVLTLNTVGPVISEITIGAYPGTQTAVKSGDVLAVTGKVENVATYAEVMAGGAAVGVASLTLGAANSGGAGYKTLTGTFIAGTTTGTQTITARARNALNTYGVTAMATNSVAMDQTYPVIGAVSITYPNAQTALKGSESATVTATVTNQTSVVYTGSADLSIANPSTYAASKTVSRVAGTYVVNVNNYTITATRASNNAVTAVNAKVSIADAAATGSITITGSPARLVSGPTGIGYIVKIATSQTVSNVSMNASSGTWSGSWTYTAGAWQRTLLIDESANSPKGAALFSGLSLTGMAGVVGSTITSGAAYTVGGFAVRTLTYDAFSQLAYIGTNVTQIAKTVAKYTGTDSNLTLANNTGSLFQGYTITDAAGNYSATGSYLFITDAAFAGSNTSGTLQLDVSEGA